MSIYALGDIQGCYGELLDLLELIDFDKESDELWFTGDLVNRGPHNVETLRFVRELGDRAKTVLGNHDLHLLAIHFGGHSPGRGDTFADVLDAHDCDDLCHWLRSLPLLYHAENTVLVHAGIPHIWSLEESQALAHEVETAMRGADYGSFFREMYGNRPARWAEELAGIDRLRIITNYLTRMRFIAADGAMDFTAKTTIQDAPSGFKEWFNHRSQVRQPIVFGHWAAIDGITNVKNAIGTDTGCVWGRQLTAVRIGDHKRFSVPARDSSAVTLSK